MGVELPFILTFQVLLALRERIQVRAARMIPGFLVEQFRRLLLTKIEY
jgi:hypothetical protein